MKKYYITGACGMMGSHLIDRLNAQGVKKENIIASFYKPTVDIAETFELASYQECDVRYFPSVHKIISTNLPDVIFHLAAQSYPTVSWIRPQETMEINSTGTINVFESIKLIRTTNPSYDPVVVVACSSAEYGASLTPENVPVKETCELLPLHPYGVSKVAQDLLSYQYFHNDHIKTVRARIFNTTGPRKKNDVLSDFTKRAVEIEKGLQTTLLVGNLHTQRALTDVRDMVNALILLSEKAKWGEVYNISGEKAYLIKDLLPIIFKEIGKELKVEVSPALVRPSDEPIIFGDSTRLKKQTGWKQEYSIETTTVDMINYWRAKL
jgi:GDP-4-dehydro-6-deoxy-D-mannose reductase